MIMKLNYIVILLLLAIMSPVRAQIAAGDSVIYQNTRYEVFAEAGAKILPNDENFALRVQSINTYVKSSNGILITSWMRKGFVHRNEVKESDEDCLLQATLQEVEIAPKTTGLVIWRIADPLPLVNIPIDAVEKIPFNE